MFIFDAHCDAPTHILRLRDFSVDNAGYAQVDFPKLRKGGVDASFFALYIPHSLSAEEAFAYAGKMLEMTVKLIEEESEVEIVTSPEQALSNKKKGVFSVFLSLENSSPLGHDMSRFKWFYDKGIRCITLCHNSDNEVCDSSNGYGLNGGLSDFGKELVCAMNEYGVLIDCAHAADKTFHDLLEYSQKPFVSTHSSCRRLCGHRRNMTDDMIAALAAKGGMININFYPAFIDDSVNAILDRPEIEALWTVEEDFARDPSCDTKRKEWEKAQETLAELPMPSYKRIVDHIDHAVSVAGVNHVGIGSDFDGICVTPRGMENVSRIGKIFDEMRSRGYCEEDIEKIAGKNMLRILAQSSDLTLNLTPSMK